MSGKLEIISLKWKIQIGNFEPKVPPTNAAITI
jgi:hypothetical protein